MKTKTNQTVRRAASGDGVAKGTIFVGNGEKKDIHNSCCESCSRRGTSASAEGVGQWRTRLADWAEFVGGLVGIAG